MLSRELFKCWIGDDRCGCDPIEMTASLPPESGGVEVRAESSDAVVGAAETVVVLSDCNENEDKDVAEEVNCEDEQNGKVDPNPLGSSSSFDRFDCVSQTSEARRRPKASSAGTLGSTRSLSLGSASGHKTQVPIQNPHKSPQHSHPNQIRVNIDRSCRGITQVAAYLYSHARLSTISRGLNKSTS